MATWQQVKNYVYANYQVSDDSGGMLTLLFQTGGGRSQKVLIVHVDTGNEFASILFMSPVAAWSQVSADRVLRATEEVPVSIRSTGDFIVATHVQLLASVDETEIDLPLAMITLQADQLEKVLGIGDLH